MIQPPGERLLAEEPAGIPRRQPSSDPSPRPTSLKHPAILPLHARHVQRPTEPSIELRKRAPIIQAVGAAALIVSGCGRLRSVVARVPGGRTATRQGRFQRWSSRALRGSPRSTVRRSTTSPLVARALRCSYSPLQSAGRGAPPTPERSASSSWGRGTSESRTRSARAPTRRSEPGSASRSAWRQAGSCPAVYVTSRHAVETPSQYPRASCPARAMSVPR